MSPEQVLLQHAYCLQQLYFVLSNDVFLFLFQKEIPQDQLKGEDISSQGIKEFGHKLI